MVDAKVKRPKAIRKVANDAASVGLCSACMIAGENTLGLIAIGVVETDGDRQSIGNINLNMALQITQDINRSLD